MHAKLEKEDAKNIPVSLVKDSPVRFECQFDRVIELKGNPPMGTVRLSFLLTFDLCSPLHSMVPFLIRLLTRIKVDIVFGKVLAVHIADSVLTGGKIDIAKTEPIARLGYYDYAVIRDTFEMKIPGTNKALLAGLEGTPRANRDLMEAKGKGEEEREQLQRSQSAGAEDGIGEVKQ